MNLEAVTQALVEQFPGGAVPELDLWEKRLERFGNFAFGGFAVVGAVGILVLILTIFSRMVIDGPRPWFGILLIAFILFAGLTLIYVVFNEDLKGKRKKVKPASPTPPISSPAVTGKLLEEREFEPVPSVVENTTDLLPARKRDASHD